MITNTTINASTHSFVTQSKILDKSMAKVCILDILNAASEEYPLTQDEIRKQLLNKYGIDVDRKTVHNHLRQLIDGISSIRYSEEPRSTSTGTNHKLSNFWIEHEDNFDDAELQVLIYNTIFSKNLPTKPKRDLINKLERLTSTGLKHKLKNYLESETGSAKTRNELFWNLEQITDAINDKRRIEFDYKEYVIQDKIEERAQSYTVSPLGVGSSNNDFYLIGILDGFKDASRGFVLNTLKSLIEAGEQKRVYVHSFRIDRMQNVQILDEKSTRLDAPRSFKIEGVRRGDLNMIDFAKFDPALKSGYTITAKLLLSADKDVSLEGLIDLFGKANVQLVDATKEQSRKRMPIVSVKGNSEMIRDFALSNIGKVELLEPAAMRQEIAELVKTALKQYKK